MSTTSGHGRHATLRRQRSCDSFSDVSSIESFSMATMEFENELSRIDRRSKASNELRDGCMLSRERCPRAALLRMYILSLQRLQAHKQPTRNSLLHQLSYVWGFDVANGECWNPDTPSNTAVVLSTWNRSFQEAEWLLLPQEADLREMYSDILPKALKRRGPFERYDTVLPPRLWRYSLVPLKVEGGRPDYRFSERQWSNLCHSTESNTYAYEDFSQPLDDLVVESTLHPYMAICDTMMKISKPIDTLRVPSYCCSQLVHVRMIWDSWMRIKVPSIPVAVDTRPIPSLAPVTSIPVAMASSNLPVQPKEYAAPSPSLPRIPAAHPITSVKRKAVDEGNTAPSKRGIAQGGIPSVAGPSRAGLRTTPYTVVATPPVPDLVEDDDSDSSASPTPSPPSSIHGRTDDADIAMDIDEPLDSHQSTDVHMLGIEGSTETTPEKLRRGLGKTRAWIRCWPRKLSRPKLFAKTNPCSRPVQP